MSWLTGLVASKLPVLDWMLMADLQLEIMSNGSSLVVVQCCSYLVLLLRRLQIQLG